MPCACWSGGGTDPVDNYRCPRRHSGRLCRVEVVELVRRAGGTASWAELTSSATAHAVKKAVAEKAIIRVTRGQYCLASVEEHRLAAHRRSAVLSHLSAAERPRVARQVAGAEGLSPCRATATLAPLTAPTSWSRGATSRRPSALRGSPRPSGPSSTAR